MLKDHFGEKIAKLHYVGHFIVLMITKKVNITTAQTMCCIFCHNNPVLNLNPKSQARKGLIIYNTITNIDALTKHVNSNHFNVLRKFEEVNYLLKEKERQPSKKRPNISSNSISSFFLQ
jgi:hypothetical protein